MAEAVSVVIPTRDRSRVVVDTVRLALTQRRVELEVIVVDDGSRDGAARRSRRWVTSCHCAPQPREPRRGARA